MTPETTSGHWAWLRDRILPWAERDPNVRAVAVLGSQVRTDRPADAWADMDLLLLVANPDVIRDRDEWIEEIGPAWVTLRHPGPLRDLPVRQVMFDGALDFDIRRGAGRKARRGAGGRRRPPGPR